MAVKEGWTDKYMDSKKAARSYRPGGLMSPGLKRARAPFLVKNVLTGVVLSAFAAAVYSYSIQAVKQEEFDDIDEISLQRQSTQPPEHNIAISAEEQQEAMESAAEALVAQVRNASQLSVAPPPELSLPSALQPPQRGVLVHLLSGRYPSLFDKQGRFLVWGAPPVDNIGKMGDKK